MLGRFYILFTDKAVLFVLVEPRDRVAHQQYRHGRVLAAYVFSRARQPLFRCSLLNHKLVCSCCGRIDYRG